MSQMILFLLLESTLETLYMVTAASLLAIGVGLPLGTILYITRKGNILEHVFLNHILSTIVNMTRSIPFIILMIAVIPLTRFLVGSSIGTNAAIVPLSLAAMPFLARVVENALLEVNKGLIEAATAMGATVWQIITKILLPEALPGIINGLTLTIISLIGYSAMAGAVGGGGLGDLAIRYGYQRFNAGIMLLTIAIMIVFVQMIQYIGDKIAKKMTHSRGV
ncbi:MAG TPA: methionine ABC transporter permease [Gammaproteobacteria bacterium]|nr:methionine ABC transporter permease [Gammaproteobacteria bacterium]